MVGGGVLPRVGPHWVVGVPGSVVVPLLTTGGVFLLWWGVGWGSSVVSQ